MLNNITNEEFRKLNYDNVLEKRIKLLEQIRENEENLLIAKEYYRNNPVDFINDWYMTYDPRRKPAWMPFILFPKQREFINFLLEREKNIEDGLIEKSRDMGATWLCMSYSIWKWLFVYGSKIAFGSWKQEKIDKLGDPDSIFEKGRIILRNLPNEFLFEDYNENKHATFLRFINPENGNSITGESGDNIGRGGRSSIYFKDEAAFYEHAEKIESALSQNTDVQIDLSTPNGMDNPFYEKRINNKIPILTLKWTDHPLKNKDWYEKQKERLTSVIVAQEIDINYSASIENVCIPAEWVLAAVDFEIPAEGPRVGGLDVADESGKDTNEFCIRHGNVIERIISWNHINTTQTARKALSIAESNNLQILNYDSIGVGAGVRGEMAEHKIEEHGIEINPIDTGKKNFKMYERVEIGKKNEDMFLNIRILLWWMVRRMFERTWEHVNGIKKHQIDEMISIPNDNKLIIELSMPCVKYATGGKIKLQSKEEMTHSPNKADALMLAFAKQETFFRARII